MSLAEFNGVRSNIIDRRTDPPVGTVSRNSTFLFGTSKSGPLHTPTRVTSENVRQIFGDVPTDSSFDTSLVRAYYEYVQSCREAPEVSLVRVGSTNAARVDLYENTAHLSGELSYSVQEDGVTPEYSMFIMALQEGAEINQTTVQVKQDDDTGEPVHMRIELPNGNTAGFNLSPKSNAAGVITRVSELCSLINSNDNLNEYIVAGFKALRTKVDVTIDEQDGNKVRTYDLSKMIPEGNHESWGDKLVSVRNVYQEKEVYIPGKAGDLIAELDIVPDKDMDSGETIDKIIRLSGQEQILSITPDLVGASDHKVDLACKDVSGWVKGYDIGGNSEHGWEFELRVRRSKSTSSSTLDSAAYDLDSNEGTVTIKESLSAGDRYFAVYRYQVAYSEAKRRSDLMSGSDTSYFVYGDQIIFGADQPSDYIIYYDSKVYAESDDIRVESFRKPVITFTNADFLPEAGQKVTIEIEYEPELPGGSGQTLVSGITQPGGLSGGSDGRRVSKKRYAQEVKRALQSVDLYPRRRNVVMGMWLDEVQPGYNPETGMPEDLPLNMWSKVLPYIDRASNLTNECDLVIPVQPLRDLNQSNINEWITRLTENSDEDLSRPANIIDSVNNFRADAPLGVFVVNIPEVNNGRRYYANPGTIYAAYKQNLPYDRSATHDFIPGNVQDLGVKIFNAETIGKLNMKRYTTAVVDYTGRFIWADAPTLGLKYRSQFDRQFVRDTVYLAVGMAREIAQKYIGKPRLPQYLLSMKKDVSKAMDMLVPEVVSDFYVDLVPVPQGYITGGTKLKIFLVTAKEIRNVEIETSISLAQD